MKNKHSNSIVKQRNRFRGLVSNLKSRSFKKGIIRDPAYTYIREMTELYLESRSKLDFSEFRGFLDWVEKQVSIVFPNGIFPNSGYAYLAGVVRVGIKRCDLKTELLWASEILRKSSKELNEFILIKDEIEKKVYDLNFKEALKILIACENQYGVSFWSHQLRVALEHQCGGLEAHKLYVSKVRGEVKGGLLGFVSYYTSIRNEDNSSITKISEDLYLRLEKNRYYDDSVKEYLKFRLLNEIYDDEVLLTNIIFIEQSHHIFDLYETFLAIARVVINSDKIDGSKIHIDFCINNILDIKDYRVERLLNNGLGGTSKFKFRDNSFHEMIYSASKKELDKVWSNFDWEMKSDPWINVYYSMFLSQFKGSKNKVSASPFYIPSLVASIFSSSSIDVGFAIDKVNKTILNYNGLPTVFGVKSFYDQVLHNKPAAPFLTNKISQGSRFYGIEDSNNISEFLKSSSINEESSENWGAYFGYVKKQKNINSFFNIFKAKGCLQENNFDDVIDILKYDFNDRNKIESSFNFDFILSAYYLKKDINSISNMIATEGVRTKPLFPLFFIEKYLGKWSWKEFKNVEEPIVACVAIHLLWKSNEKAETASMLRFAIRYYLRSEKLRFPSDLINTSKNVDLKVRNYFFRVVCKGEFIDQLLKGSNDLLRERQSICAQMCSLDYEHLDDYKNELGEIASALALVDGKKIIDRTRVYVDDEGVKRWAKKELIEDYKRYHDLVDVSVKTSFEIEFNEILKEMIDKKGQTIKWDSIDKNSESEMVFLRMLARLSDEFLNSPEFGLDFYLSKRIRHQSFIGLIRGPLEFDNLITTKGKNGEYHENDELLSDLTSISDEKIKLIDFELRRFSKKFDDLLEMVKNSLFQIESQDKPKGLINLKLSERNVLLLKIMSHKVSSFDDFIDVAMQMFWLTLKPSLDSVKNYISTVLKQSIDSHFEDLMLNLKKHNKENNSEFSKLILGIKSCSVNVLREIDKSAQWFKVSSSESTVQNSFAPSQLLDIAIDSTLKCHQSFHPEITRNEVTFDEDLLLDTGALIWVHDVLFVALSNVFHHSNLDKPKVSIETNISPDNYSIKIISQYKSNDLAETALKLDGIRKLIRDKKFERRTRKEGGSGLLKIAAVALQDPLGRICFDVTESDFVLDVSYRILLSSIEVEEGHANS